VTALALRSARSFGSFWQLRLAPNWRRAAVLLLLAALLGSSAEARDLVVQAMADAYLQVTVFVAATLAAFYVAERALKVDLGAMMTRHADWQPAIAALLGALPGCGGAIVVVTQFTRGYASFGALISVLVATMGDAAFLLIARDPASAAIVIGISLIAGTITGMIVDRVHGRDFMRQTDAVAAPVGIRNMLPRGGKGLWFALLAPGVVLGALIALQFDPDAIFGIDGLTLWLGFAGAALSMVLWTLTSGNAHALAGTNQDIGTRTAVDTNFVTAWVVMAFLAYELFVYALGVDIGTMFRGYAPMLPLAAILVGFIPGCGPQIVVATLYLAGAIPLSAQLANGIANDGDALFPALALAPRAAILATLYSAIPALLVGYGWLFLLE
jgi:hypothetical protein